MHVGQGRIRPRQDELGFGQLIVGHGAPMFTNLHHQSRQCGGERRLVIRFDGLLELVVDLVEGIDLGIVQVELPLPSTRTIIADPRSATAGSDRNVPGRDLRFPGLPDRASAVAPHRRSGL